MIKVNVLLALGYFWGGYLGTVISIPPSHASPIWPAAGIALAGIVTYGRGVIPGIWLGALITQIFAFSNTSTLDNVFFSLIIGVVASTAATLQAALGAGLIRRAIGLNNPLIDDGSILRFMALGGPVSCVISASAGIITLTLQGVINLNDIPTGWVTWWIGDTIGVLIFTPIVLCFIGMPRHLWRTRICSVALPLLMLSLLVLAILHLGKQQEQTRISTLFQERCNLLHTALQNTFAQHIAVSQNLKAFFDHSEKVTADEFKHFTKIILNDHPNIQAMEWIPRMTADNRSLYEPVSGSTFTLPVPADKQSIGLHPTQADYFAIAYIEPYPGNEYALGPTVNAKSQSYEAIQKAMDTDETTVSGIIRWLQASAGRTGVVIYSPVYQPHQPLQTVEQRRLHLMGVTAGVILVNDIVSAVKTQFKHLHLLIKMTDNDVELVNENTHVQNLTLDFPTLEKILPLQVADRIWTVTYTTAPQFYTEQLSWNIWWLILGGFFLTGLTGAGLLMLTGRTMQTEDTVKIRTWKLETEIIERKAAEVKTHRLAQLFALLSQCNQAIVRCTDAQELFLQICRDSVQIDDIKMVCIGLIDTATQQVKPVASFGDGVEYLQNLSISMDPQHSDSRSPTGIAIFENRPIWCQDFLNDPILSPWRELGVNYGWRGLAVLPIHNNGMVTGVFALYADKVNAFDAAVRDLLVEMAQDISFALDNFDRETRRKQAEQSLQESEQFLRTIIDTEPECVKVVDHKGQLLSMNAAGLRMLEADTLEAAKQYSLLNFVLPEYRKGFIALHKRVIGGKSGTFEFEVEGLKGARRRLETYAAPLRTQSSPFALMLAVTRDITERKQADAQLKLAARVFEQSNEGFMITDAQRKIIKINPAYTLITGYSEADALGHPPSMLSSGHHEPGFYHNIWNTIDTQNYWQGEIWNRRKNGEAYPELLNISVVRDDAGNISEYIGVFADITQLKASEAQLEFLAHHDPLTALPNRMRLFFRLEHALETAKREGRQFALLMLDLDRFKNVNDSFGHLAGDQLLQLVAKRLTARLREIDTVCRLGGDEFTVLLENISHPEDAARIAQEIIADLGEPWAIPGCGEVLIGVSIGISLYPQYGDTPELLLQQADTALYKAKESGRNRFAYFSHEFTVAARERIDLETRLRRAIAQNELRVHYQPQIDIKSGAIVGAEALVRWQDPIEGLISPDRFITMAEQTGLITLIGAWVLKETCRQGKQWLDAGIKPLTLAVNISPYQLRQGNIAELVADILLETEFPAEHLELELTESGLMERPTEVIERLNKLRAQGIRLAIDDFGTGYSSLAHLKRFPLDVLKIDKSFIDDIPHQQDDMEIAAAIISMGHILGFKVLAEGVETQGQLDFLEAKGCDSYQGYIKSPPLPAEDFAVLLEPVNTIKKSNHSALSDLAVVRYEKLIE